MDKKTHPSDHDHHLKYSNTSGKGSSSLQPLLHSLHHDGDSDIEDDDNNNNDTLLAADSGEFDNMLQRQNLLVDTAGMTRLGMLRAYWLGAVVCIGGFLCTFSNTTFTRPMAY